MSAGVRFRYGRWGAQWKGWVGVEGARRDGASKGGMLGARRDGTRVVGWGGNWERGEWGKGGVNFPAPESLCVVGSAK